VQKNVSLQRQNNVRTLLPLTTLVSLLLYIMNIFRNFMLTS